jgi:hypothetical protein
MNTGMGDAVDLGWKLAATLDGWGGQYLIDTYNTERQPVGERAVNAAAKTFNALITTDDYSALLHDGRTSNAAIEALGEKLREATYGEWDSHTLGMQLGYRYENSPICIHDGSVPPPDDHVIYTPTSRPGSRAPHAWMKDGRSTLDLFGRGFVLLHSTDVSPGIERLTHAAELRRVPLSIVDVSSEDFAELYSCPFVLVRPDGHVAWRGEIIPDDALNLIDIIRGAVI